MKIKLKQIANSRDLSLYGLAKLLGMPQQTIYSWGNGRTQPSYDNMDLLCHVLDCTIGDIFEAEPVQMKLNTRQPKPASEIFLHESALIKG